MHATATSTVNVVNRRRCEHVGLAIAPEGCSGLIYKHMREVIRKILPCTQDVRLRDYML